jgi:hypothetical protein
LIDADELKKKLETERCDCEVIQIIDDTLTIEAEPINYGWISVGDRLPPKGCDVLVCDFDDYAGVGYFDGTKWNIDGFEMSTPPVSHWQPIPEPPERSDKL